ncbi:tyrosine-type recombinase/integrase [Nonomuraea angiospora]|uniref:tyrosine-type recombinase/integrase n=1 Tax=Nonomuraea angiospora TaxID=46172 RepID=UPI0033340980
MIRSYTENRTVPRLAVGGDWAESGFVFTDELGRPLHPQHVTDRFYWLCYEAGLPPIRLHDLRHGAATAMLAAGVDIKIVQETLGHTSSAFTRDTYTSVYPEAAAAAAEATAALLAAQPPVPPSASPGRRTARPGTDHKPRANDTSGKVGGSVIHLPPARRPQ